MARTNFLSLPRELRDTIYALGFESGYYRCEQGDWLFDLRLGPLKDQLIQRPPLWLLASKQIMDEGLQQFYREAVCTNIQDREIDECEQSHPSVLNPRNVQHLQANLEWDVQTPIEISDGDGGTLIFYRDERIVNGLWGRSPRAHNSFLGMGLNAKSLTAQFSYGYDIGMGLPSIEEEPPQFRYKFHVLEVYGQSYERIRIYMEQPFLSTYQQHPEKQTLLELEVFYTAFQTEIQRWAIEKVSGPENHPYVVRNWMDENQDGKDSKTGHKWCFEVRRAKEQGSSSVNHRGVFSYEYGGRTNASFGGRTEGADGLVEWSSDQGRKERIVRPRWLVEFANEGRQVGDSSILGKRKFPR